MTRVVNLRRESFEVYIGRAGQGQDGYFGNPFKGSNRAESVRKFHEYFLKRIQADFEFKTKVESLKGKTLGCFCKPLDCHGDVIADWLDECL